MNQVIVTRPMIGICHMQVCAEQNSTDEKILEVCNTENPAGTTNGWSRVIRKPEGTEWEPESCAPGPCEEYPDRTHFLIVC